MQRTIKLMAWVYMLMLCGISLAQPTPNGNGFRAIVVGDGLNWESNEFNMTVTVTQRALITINIYSPGFDPEDYRADWRGGVELGDERYDQGQGSVSSEFFLSVDGNTLASKSYGVEPHRNDVFFSGTLEPGEYTLTSKFYGNGKNAFVYNFETNPSDALMLFIEPFQAIVDPNLTNYNITRGEWQKPFSIRNRTGHTTTIGIYDGDGEDELKFRLGNPQGQVADQPVSGDLLWRDHPLNQQGNYDFFFLVPDSAYQYTNTIGVRADCRLKVGRSLFDCVTPAYFDITKSVSPTRVAPGDNVAYTITVTNKGGSWGLARVQDVLPEGFIGGKLDEVFALHPGQSRTFNVEAQVPTNWDSGCATNTAWVLSRYGRATASADLCIVGSPAQPAAFSLSKTVDRPTAQQGETVAFTITLYNVGGTAGTVNLIDTLPTGFTGTGLNQQVTLAPGQSESYTVSASINQQATCNDYLVNRAYLQNSPATEATAQVYVSCPIGEAAFSVSKTVDRPTAQHGETLTYAITVYNVGEQTGSINLIDTLPTGLSGSSLNQVVTLAAGQSETITLSATVNEQAPCNTNLTNRAYLSNYTEATTEASATTYISCPAPPPPPPPAFSVDKVVDRPTVRLGEAVNYTVTVNNIGSTTGSVHVTDILPTGLSGQNLDQTISLAAGQSQSFSVPVVVNEQAPCDSTLPNRAVIRSEATSSEAVASIYISCPLPAQFTLLKTVDRNVVNAGETVNYTITVGNVGGTDGTVVISDQLPQGLLGQSFNQTIAIPAGQSQSFSIPAQVAEGMSGTINNCATVSGGSQGTLQDCAPISITPPPGAPRFTLQKSVDKLVYEYGEEVFYSIAVENIGDASGNATLRDTLPSGVTGVNLFENLALASGERKVFTLNATVDQGAPSIITNTAFLESNVGNLEDSAIITVVTPPLVCPVLTKEVFPSMARAGDIVTFTMTVRNDANVAQDVTLEDTLPLGLIGQILFEEFTLAPGAQRTFSLDAMLADDAPDTMINFASISTPECAEITSNATVFLEETPPDPAAFTISKRVDRIMAEVGDRVTFRVNVSNTGGQAGRIIVEDLLPPGLLGDNLSEELFLEAGQSRTFLVEATLADSVRDNEIIENEACLIPQGEDEILNRCATAVLTARNPVVIPTFNEKRFSDIDLHFESEGNLGMVMEVLITHIPPVGSTYQPGSAVLNGAPIGDPFITPNGRLVWRLQGMDVGDIRYRVMHTGKLPPVEDPTFTVRSGNSDIVVAGDIQFADLPRFGFDREAILPRRRVCDLDVVSHQLNVGNRQPIEIGLELIGNVAGTVDYITVASNLEPISPDASTISGHQVAVGPGGNALIKFQPQPTTTSLELEFLYSSGEQVRQCGARVGLLGAEGGFVNYHIGVRGRLLGGDLFASAFAEGYLELPVGPGRLQIAADAGVNLSEFSFDRVDVNRGLIKRVSPFDTWQLLGAGNEARQGLASDYGIALKFDTGGTSVGFYRDSADLPGAGATPDVTGGQIEATLGDGLYVRGIVAPIAADQLEVIFDGDVPNKLDGTRIHPLGSAVRTNTDVVTLITAEGERPLRRLTDYHIDYAAGLLILAKPLYHTDSYGNPVKLRVQYAPVDDARTQLGYGAGIEYSAGAFTFGAGVMHFYRGLEIGAEAEYNTGSFTLQFSYKGNLVSGRGVMNQYGLTAYGDSGALETDLAFTYSDDINALTGRGRLAYRILPGGRIALEHDGGFGTNESRVLYEQSFGNFGLGAGVGYWWERQVLSGLLRGYYDNGPLRIAATQSFPFSGNGGASRTDLELDYDINENLTATGVLKYLWGEAVAGSLGLEQHIGAGTYALQYDLPTASGDGNVARIGVDTPLELNDDLGLDLHAGYSHDFKTGEGEASFGGSVRYSGDGLNASLGIDVALPSNSVSRVTLRGGVNGQLGPDSTIGLSANYQISPVLRGRANLSYALKLHRLNLLTYNNLITDDAGTRLEGEIAPTYHVASHFQLRPSAAYRINFSDASANTYQAGVGGIYYFGDTPTFGVGGYAYYVTTPGLNSSGFGGAIELRAQVIEQLWVTLGYAFGQAGLGNFANNGLYFAVDLIGGSQF